MLILALIRAILLSRTSLALENLALRQQVATLKQSVPRHRIRLRDRIYWLVLRRLWSGWRDTILIVRPATVVAWYRQGFRLFWRWRSRGTPGRPPITAEVRELIRRLSTENRFWGAPRIQAELDRLGHRVAKSTVERYMVRHRGPPSGTWRAFLRNHAGEILACDFFLVPTATFKTLIGFVVIELGRRRIVACDMTAHPTAGWAASVVRRAVLAAGGRARYLLRDRDSIYGEVFKAAMRSVGLRQVVTAYHAPLQNAFAERVIGTIRRECLDHLIVMGEGHARGILDEYVRYYNEDRTHQALGAESPVPGFAERAGSGPIESIPYLGGLHHGYRRAA
jgi:transposase InsO family protein